jgi:hypothetical protein
VVDINGPKNTYNVSLRSEIKVSEDTLNTPRDVAFNYPIRHFEPNQEEVVGLKHEITEKFTMSLIPTDESLSSESAVWFREGIAMHASGELNQSGYLSNYAKLKSEGEEWFTKRNTPGVNAGHLMGSLFYTTLETDYGMTPEQNRAALGILRDAHKDTNQPITKMMVWDAYSIALNTNLDGLLELFEPGFKLFYSK